MQSTERIDDCLTWQLCCLCPWQSTKGPHGLSLWPGTVNRISCHGFSVTQWQKSKPLDGTVTTLASISLASASAALLVKCCCVVAYAEWAVARTLRQRASALFVYQVHFRAHRSLLPITHSPKGLIVVRSSTPSLTRHLSCGAWAPPKSGGDCWYDLHVLLGDVRTQCYCCRFCNQQCWLLRNATMLMLLPAMTTQRSLANAFVAMAVAERTVSLQALWRFIAMVRGYNWHNQFHCERFGAFMIVKGCGPAAHCGKGLVVALHGVLGLKGLRDERLIIVLHDVRGQLPLWQGAHHCTQPSCHPWQGVCLRLL